MLEAIREVEAKISTIKVAFLISVNRAAPAESATEAVDLLIKFREKHLAADPDKKQAPRVVGLELSGDPRSGDFATFRDEFKRA